VILPGATLGLLGGGQLGRMFTAAARTLGYGVTVLDPDPLAPAAEFATKHIVAPYDDRQALDEIARSCAAVTTEFENAPAGALDAIATRAVVRPSGSSVAVAQDRRREKGFFSERGFPAGAWATMLFSRLLTMRFTWTLGFVEAAAFGFCWRACISI